MYIEQFFVLKVNSMVKVLIISMYAHNSKKILKVWNIKESNSLKRMDDLFFQSEFIFEISKLSDTFLTSVAERETKKSSHSQPT